MDFVYCPARDCLQQNQKVLRDHFFKTDFYKTLTGEHDTYCFQNVQRWTKHISWRDIGRLFIPICLPNHFVLILVNFAAKSIFYYDSLLNDQTIEGAHVMLQHVLRWVRDEFHDKCSENIDVRTWNRQVVQDAPQQSNEFDCGVFVCKYADYLSSGCSTTFEQDHFPYFRQRMLIEIAAGTLLL